MNNNDALTDIMPDGLPKILPAYEDGVFQALLTLPEANLALKSLISAVLDQPVKAVLLSKNIPAKRDKGAKREQYDINCIVDTENGEQCNLEIQASPMEGDNLENEHRNLKWRSVFNLCDLHSGQYGRGIMYGQFVRSYQVMLSNYRAFKEKPKIAERFTFRNLEGVELCDAVTAIFIDLSQAEELSKKPVSELSDIEQWAAFIALANEPEYGEVIEEITKQQEGIAVAKKTLYSISQNPDQRARFRSRRIWLQDRRHDIAAGEARGEARGEAKGEAKGKAEEKRDIAKNLLKLDIPIDQIITATGLSREEIKALSE